MAKIIKMGSLHLDGVPIKCGTEIGNHTMSIGDTFPGKELAWVSVNGLLIANQTVCVSVSWEQLNNLGYIFGKPIFIDGASYFCRTLKVGNEANIRNEWDLALTAVGKKDAFWNLKDIYFWGQEMSIRYPGSYMIRGGGLARTLGSYDVSTRLPILGFRPVLEPVVENSLISNPLIGTFVRAHGPDSVIAGTLTDISDYDLFFTLAPDDAPVFDCDWYCQSGKRLVAVNRATVTVTKEA